MKTPSAHTANDKNLPDLFGMHIAKLEDRTTPIVSEQHRKVESNMTHVLSSRSIKQSRPVPRRLPFLLALLVIALVTLFGWHAMSQPGFSSGSRTGYNMGLAGAVLMLILFLYPLRKHVRWLSGAGPLREWLNFHMLLGICGPLLIMFHSRFHIGSANAAIAMASMLVVAGSGIIGRFIYTRIHHELRGSKMAALELRVALADALARIEGGRSLPARAKFILEGYESHAERVPRGIPGRTLQFLLIGIRRHVASVRIHRRLRQHPDAHWIASQIDGYLAGLQRVAQFSVYERLFSLWHLFHIPLVVLLTLSAVFHVVAVHMY